MDSVAKPYEILVLGNISHERARVPTKAEASQCVCREIKENGYSQRDKVAEISVSHEPSSSTFLLVLFSLSLTGWEKLPWLQER